MSPLCICWNKPATRFLSGLHLSVCTPAERPINNCDISRFAVASAAIGLETHRRPWVRLCTNNASLSECRSSLKGGEWRWREGASYFTSYSSSSRSMSCCMPSRKSLGSKYACPGGCLRGDRECQIKSGRERNANSTGTYRKEKKKKSFTNTLINLGFNLLPEFAN